ncbi:hypothetical protein ACFSVM_00215 [Paenibacillus shunpengii]|uniref:Uncharacterized protein n=1 Tax=Paenibacillus shunpengii TaxID=2054424 RepID=A0ABW5SIE6_9BACL|nr:MULTISPECIES: hypothetical protein [unclassified Paenibacillus]OMC72378.1 hypothetical protein BK126_10450 [Paenibacillus sp. FSL H7-0326]SDX40780.1 hypothetical protein SAMN05518848_10741 [Paenibacillus sp. PDC88]
MKNTILRHKNNRKSTVKWMAVLSSAALLLPAGWSPAFAQNTAQANTSAPAAAEAVSSESSVILNKFRALLKQPNGLPEAATYLNKNISKASPHHATLMVLYLENARIKAMPSIDKKLYPQDVQEELQTFFKENDTMNQLIQKAKTQKVKNLLTQAKNYGYKVITAEGMYFLTMDYSAFERYEEDVKEDISAYISIQSELSRKQLGKDAALAIGYQELVNRALLLEGFVNNYPNSNRTRQMEDQYDLYRHVIFYGMNNTPLFQDNGAIRPHAKTAYTFIAGRPNDNNSQLHELLKQFVNVLKDHQFKQTSEVKDWLEEHVGTNG